MKLSFPFVAPNHIERMRFLSLFCFSPASFSTQNAAYEIYFHRITNQLKCLLNDNISESGFRILLLHIEMQFRCSTDQLRHFLNSLGWLVYHQIIIMRFLGILNNYLQHIGALHLQMSSLTIFFCLTWFFFYKSCPQIIFVSLFSTLDIDDVQYQNFLYILALNY